MCSPPKAQRPFKATRENCIHIVCTCACWKFDLFGSATLWPRREASLAERATVNVPSPRYFFVILCLNLPFFPLSFLLIALATRPTTNHH